MEASPKRMQFLKRRMSGIGGSDVGPVLGVDQYRDSLDVYLSKVKQPAATDTPNEAMLRGIYLEPVVGKLYIDETGRRIRQGKFRRAKSELGKMEPMIANPDRIIHGNDDREHDGNGVLELKTANRWVMDRIKDQGIPESYYLQVQHYMGVCGLSWGAVAILCPDPFEFVHFDVKFDAELYGDTSEVLRRFWSDNVLTETPPSPPALVMPTMPKLGAGEVVIRMDENAEWREAVAFLREARGIEKSGKQSVEFAKSIIKELMPEKGIYEGAGARVLFNEQAGRTSFDKKSLAAFDPIDPIRMASLLAEAGLALDVIETLFEAARLDLSIFEKQGAAFETVRIYDSKE